MAKKSVEHNMSPNVLLHAPMLKVFTYALVVLLSYLVLITILTKGIVFGFQHALNIFALVISIKELEILFYAHDKKMNRAEAKVFVKDNQAFLSALMIGLFIPYFTPVVITVIVGVIAVLVAKLIFGGYTFRIFSPSILAAVMLSLGFRISLTSTVVPDTFDTQIFKGLSSLPLFNDILNTVLNITIPTFISNGAIFILITLLILTMRFFKHVWFALLSALLFVIGYVAIFQDFSYTDIILSAPFMISIVFILTDPILQPKSNVSKLVNALIFAVLLNIFIAIGQTHAVWFSVLAMQLVIPFFNQSSWFTAEDQTKESKAFQRTKFSVYYSFILIAFLVVVQLGWSYYGPQIGKPKVDVLQYFETYETYTQRFTPSRSYNSDAYGSIQDVYEIEDSETQTLVLLMYNIVVDGFWGPINVIVVIDPYTDIIVNYYVVRHEEVQGAAYFDDASVNDVMNQSVATFAIPEDLTAGATGTYNALQSIVSDIINHYVNEEVSLNENLN